ncbi:calcium-translocating P-type ATPase [Emericellopsis atlantica]|uniref:Calcium-transporting ATPase n=1 Tax=Emericellopsis atlantica TaxID=2614577 RepID=A0A9P8CRD0_9HYPO|nr:calcium-translocating P-type ATPase [Emericellopsis atlantica]KAG9256889.1 calcium-translocating P-type ATPase [Emericellopsis atlantica]
MATPSPPSTGLPHHQPSNSNNSNTLSPPTLSPPTLQVDTSRQRAHSNADTVHSRSSGLSNPFLTPAATSAASSIIEDPETALRPDPGTEADFHVENNPFAYTPGQLNKLLNPKSLSAFKALGGLQGIVKGLQTNVHTGLSVDETEAPTRVSFDSATKHHDTSSLPETDSPVAHAHTGGEAFSDRIRVFKKNVLPPKKPTPFYVLVWRAYNDVVLIVLTVAAAISLALGLYETLGREHPPGEPMPVDWVEGVAICVAIIIVVVTQSFNDWQKERAFVKLSARKEEREIKVIRSGKSELISVHDVLVGDILHLEPGDLVPVDGILVEGHDLKCDESSATGESDALKKTGGDTVMRALESGQSKAELDPFIISGAKVLEGMGTFVATSVGVNSSFGKIMMSVRTEMEATPLQKKLERLALAIAKLGTSAAALLFFVLLFKFLANLSDNPDTPTEKASTFTDILIVGITIIVVAVPEGLPLAVTLALAFATTRMLRENNLVRVLRACETMGNATTICSDKTGTLTTNKMTVIKGTFGKVSITKTEGEKSEETSMADWSSNLPEKTKQAIIQSVAINSTAFEGEEEGRHTFIGSKTETALLSLAKEFLGMGPLAETRANEEVIQMFPFDSKKKCMGAVIKLKESQGGGYRLLVKGASEILLNYCGSRANIDDLKVEERFPREERKKIRAIIDQYASKSLRTIGLVYKDYTQWPPAHAEVEEGHADFASLLHDLVFMGVVGIQDPVRPGVPEAVAKATHAGVKVRMVTGDNIITARAIATECGIYTEGGLVMEGPAFRKLSDAEFNEMLPRLQVLARSSPEDKRILVTKLKALGETVAVTGDGTNDAPALKAADVGFSMGISGTEVAKEASAIVLMDDNFTSIITALKWGRAVNDAVQKFLQFQITVNITAVLLAFITAVYSPTMDPVLKAVQLLWVNLIMDTFAALALATDPPTEKILDRPPQGKKAPLITINMWKMIIGQAIFQLVVILILYFAGPEILNYDRSDHHKMRELDTVIFNTFVWMQIFNEFNNRRLDNKFNIFEGIHRNIFFIIINMIMVGLQICIIFVGSRAFAISDGGIDGTQWAISVIVALMCWPWAVLVRLCPDAWFEVAAKTVGGPFALVYRFLRKGWRATIGRLFKRSKKDDADGEEKDAADTADINEHTVTEEKVKDLENTSSPAANVPIIHVPDEMPATENAPAITTTAPEPPRVEVTSDHELPKTS